MRFRKIILLIFAVISLILILIEIRHNVLAQNDFLQVESKNSEYHIEQLNDTTEISIDSLWENTEFVE